MTFLPEKAENFFLFFEDYKNKIRNFHGCQYLLVLRDKNNPHIVFSYSHWNREEDLDNYRHSELFKKVWAKTKELFQAKPEAWTTEILHNLI